MLCSSFPRLHHRAVWFSQTKTALRGIVWVIWADLGYGSTVRASAARSRGRCAGRRRRGRAPPPGRAVMPAALHAPARPPRRVCDRRVGERMRACGSAKILRTIELGIPEGDTHLTAGTVVAAVACVYHVRFLRSPDSASSRTQSGVPPPQPPFLPTHFHEDPHFLLVPSGTCTSSPGKQGLDRESAERVIDHTTRWPLSSQLGCPSGQ